MSKYEHTSERPFWYDGKFVNEVGFCEDFLQKHPMVRVCGSFFTKDGRITDEESVRKEIYEMLRPYLNCGLAKRASARFWEVSHCSVKSDMPTCEQDIMPLNLNGFTINRIFHYTAKSVCQRAHRLRCFHYPKLGGSI